MKTSQWIGALGVLVIMVFVITFAMNFLRTGTTEVRPTGPGPGPDGNYRSPTFFVKSLPADPTDPMMAIYQEERKEGFVDFLMENPYDQDIKIGLIGKNCRCASVEVVPATPAWKTHRAMIAAAEIVAEWPAVDVLGPELFAQVKHRALRPEQDRQLQEMQRALPATAKLETEGTGPQETILPAKTMGFIRLGWNNTKSGVEHFSAKLWIGSPNSNVTQDVEADVRLVPPLRIEFSDVKAGELNETDLEKKPFEASIRVWSATRPGLQLKAEAIRPVRFDTKRWDPFDVGPPVPLSPEELANLKRLPDAAGTVLCAFRIPIKLSGRSPDGKDAVDLGGFRRRLRLWSDGDTTVEPMEMTVTGSVQGSVQIGSSQDSGRILLGVFDRSSGSPEQAIILTGRSAGVDLDVEKDRTSEFLREGTVLEKIAPLAGLPRWKLRVQVKPNGARGTFPRGEDATYRDSAVYLKVKGEVVQNVRVPVEGTANER